MSQTVICSVLPGEQVRVEVVTDAMASFAAFRRKRLEPFLPIGGFECDPKHFTEATSWKLPCEKPLSQGAFIFQRAPVPSSISRALMHHLDLLGDRASPLFNDWHRAVAEAQNEQGEWRPKRVPRQVAYSRGLGTAAAA